MVLSGLFQFAPITKDVTHDAVRKIEVFYVEDAGVHEGKAGNLNVP